WTAMWGAGSGEVLEDGSDNGPAQHPLTTFTHGSRYGWFINGSNFAGNGYAAKVNTSSVSQSLENLGGNSSGGRADINGWSMNPDAAIAWGRATGGPVRITLDGGST